MRFSELFHISRDDDDDWFDPVLSVDTPLFLDPFLLYDHEQGVFDGSHAEVIGFFNAVFSIVAKSAGNVRSTYYRKALGIMRFPEVEELCLGYASSGTKGSGTGAGFAATIVGALWQAIQAGVKEITHFEEVGILSEGIGADRISDITAFLLRRRLAEYTERICERHGVPMRMRNYRQGVFDGRDERWRAISTRLPLNPYTRQAVLLVPYAYLRSLPTINASDFWDYCYSNENDLLRTEFNYDVSKRISKPEIIRVAKRHPQMRRRYLTSVERRLGTPYDFVADPKGCINWYPEAQQYCARHPLGLSISQPNDFSPAVQAMVTAFRHFVEENGGWRLLWNDDSTSRGEEAAQRLFLGTVAHYCRANNIDVSPEPNIGRGPVDFKVSRGHQFRTLLEVKLARNTRFWHGLRDQLPTYLRAEQATDSYFIVIIYDHRDELRVAEIKDVAADVSQRGGCSITPFVVDARPKLSASRL